MNETRLQRALYLTALASLLALIVLCTAWELVLAPLRPGGSWMALKALPLLLPLAGVIRRSIYTLQWASMLVLLYFMEGVVRAWSEPGMSFVLAWAEIVLSSAFYFSAIFFLRPYKQAAKKMAAEAIRKAASLETDE